eukprot:NODE_52_length_30984_cov_1.383358.p7 type:complete len:435 gc:universal NODE_52_length_30984_cov_1.383358:20408-21712(+)
MVEDNSTAAESAKQLGNKYFKEKHYDKAINAYTEAIKIEERPAFYCNRAMANFHLEYYGQTISDANSAILLDDKFFKAFYRRGCAYVQLLKFDEAIKDFKLVYTNTKDPNAYQHLVSCDKIIKQRKFEEAIRVEETNPFDKEDWKQMIVSDYSGPSVDAEFSIELVYKCAEYMKEKSLHRKLLMRILVQCYEAFRCLDSIVDIKVPKNGLLTICGDTHGQYFDVLNIFGKYGWPSESHYYLFNGDFVDRGSWSVEVITLLLLIKCALPNSIYLTRGNHETNDMNKVYGFEGEVKAKYSSSLFPYFTEIFNALPLGFLIENRIFVCHGGLCSETPDIDSLRKINRFKQPQQGFFTELLWSDPCDADGVNPSKRGAGISFGSDITKSFCEKNAVELVIRSHEVKEEGFEIAHNGKCITIFSAPNYCDQMVFLIDIG